MEAKNEDSAWAEAAVKALLRNAVEALYMELQVLIGRG
jgi:hypothetical protein